MKLAYAVSLVVEDQRAGDEPDLSAREAIAHVLNTLRLPEDPYVAGGYPLDDDGSELYEAYRTVLTAGTNDLVEIVGDETDDDDEEEPS